MRVSFLRFFLVGLIDLILYMLSIYSVIYFFYTTISSLKKGSIIINRAEESARLIKIFLFLFPQINIYNTSNLLIFAYDYRSFKYKYLIEEKLKGITYLECTIFFITEIIFYSLTALFIQSYKNSGLSFCQFLKSFFTKVSRNIDLRQQPLIDGQEDQAGNELDY